MEAASGTLMPSQAQAQNTRLYALDSLRGLAIALMILVNTPGDWGHAYSGLLHAPWHGFRLADIVFPMFLFAVGAGMYFSMQRSQAQALSRGAMQLHILRRGALLILIGLLLHAFPFTRELGELRIMGVLQRIGLAYLLAATLVLYLGGRVLYGVAGLILLGYWLLLWTAGPSPYSLETNLVRQLDILVLGPAHMYRVEGVPFDPEGLLSSLPAVVSVLAGYWTAQYLISARLDPARLLRVLATGSMLLVLGGIWGWLFPINKALWTSSYVLFSTGLILCVLAALLWFQDIMGFKRVFQPLNVYGLNPLFIYVLAWFWTATLLHWQVGEGERARTASSWIYQSYFLPLANPGLASLLFALAHVLLFWLLAWVLYRKRIVIKL